MGSQKELIHVLTRALDTNHAAVIHLNHRDPRTTELNQARRLLTYSDQHITQALDILRSIRRQPMEVIDSFSREYEFLSNFYPHPIHIDGKLYDTVEHYYQASKTLEVTQSERIRIQPTPGKAKREGQKVTLRDDWPEVKTIVMMRALEAKFDPDGPLAPLLLGTGNAMLIEGNHHHDNIWGDCNCTTRAACMPFGFNMLGYSLMYIRARLRVREQK